MSKPWSPYKATSDNGYNPMQGGMPAPVSNSYDYPDDNTGYMAGGMPTPIGAPALIPAQSQNAQQRWASGSGMPAISGARRYFTYFGRIDGRAPQAQGSTGLSTGNLNQGGSLTDPGEWDNLFTPHLMTPRSNNTTNVVYPPTPPPRPTGNRGYATTPVGTSGLGTTFNDGSRMIVSPYGTGSAYEEPEG